MSPLAQDYSGVVAQATSTQPNSTQVASQSRTATPDTFSLQYVFYAVFSLYQTHWKFLTVATIVYGLALFIPGMLSDAFADSAFLSGLISVLGWLIKNYFQAGFLAGIFTIISGQQPVMKQLFSVNPKIVAMMLLTNIVHSALLLGSFLLLLIPGLYVYVRLQFVYFLVVDQSKSAIDAIKGSWALSKNNFWLLAKIAAISFIVNLMGGLLLGVGLLITVPFTTVFSAYYYRLLASK